MLALFLAAALLGLVYNAMPGAVFAETVRQGIRGGYRAALAVQIGSLTGDALWAVLGLAGIGLLLQLEWLRLPLGLAGTGYLLWLAWDTWQSAGRKYALDLDPGHCQKRALRAGMLISLTNPHNLAFWAAAGSALAAAGIQEPQPLDYAVFFTGFMLCSLLWCFVCAALVARVVRSSSRRWTAFLHKACAFAFLLFALAALRDVLVRLL